METTLIVLFLVVALVLFVVSAIGWVPSPTAPSRFNLIALGLAFLTLALLVPAVDAMS